MDKSNNKLSQKIAQDLDMDISETLSDEEMIKHISYRVEQMMKGDPDLLMSYLYRLDVEEENIKAAMETSITPAHITFANLIWERQKQRMETKKKYKQDPIEGWEL
ncbi:hypothetical protein N9176_00580 [bacterium]|nr:hypothetical protein [bacterium]